jgi:transporter family protein
VKTVTGRWLIPALCYLVITAGLGVTTKLSLRHLRWPDMIVWTAIVYAVSAVVIAIVRGAHLGLGVGDVWAVASGVLAVTGLVALFVALDNGPVTKVVPVTAAYPLVSALLAIAVFGERISLFRAGGILMVVLGVVLLSVQRA